MRPNRLAFSLLLLIILLGSPALSLAEPAKALKYHKALLRRPAPGYLFDRFFNAWVEEESVESLANFLQSQADASASDGLLLAFFHAKQGDDVLAIEQFRKTLADEPGNAVAWHQKAVVEARSLNFETALSDLAKARDADPDDELATRIATLQARLLVRSGQRDKALKAFAELIAQRPDDEELVEDVIELQVDEDLHDEAAKLCKQLIESTKDPYKKLLRRLRLGGILQQAGKREAAVKTYESTLADAGAESWLEREILAQIERVFRREEDLGGLKREYESLAEKYPKRIAVLRGQTRTLADSGDGKEAIEQFRKILAITPGDRDNQQEFIQLHLRIDDFAGARKQLEKLIELQPKDAELQVQLAEVAAKLKDNATVVAAVDSYLEKSDASEYAHLRSARLLDRLDQTDAAKAKYELLTKTFPESRSAKEARAAFLYKAGDKEQAIELWRAAADGGDSQQVVRVAKMLGARQEHAAAYELLEQQQEALGQDTLFLSQIVDTALALKKYKEAVPLARRRVDLSETTAELDQSVAQAAKAVDRAKLSVELIEELKALPSPTTQQACLLAELFDRNGDPQRADQTLEPLLTAGDPLAVAQQIRLARLRRDWDTAALAAERALDLPDGRNSRNMRQLIGFYERSYRPDEALKRLPEWKRLSPGSSSPWLTEARLLQSEGKESEAIEVLREASRRLDDPREVRSRLAQLYTSAGKLADAERLYWLDYEESDDLLAKVRSVEQLARVAENAGKTPALVANFEERRRENRTSIEPLMALATIHRVAQNYDKRIQVLGEAAKMRPDDLQLLSQIARIQEQEGDWEAARDTLRRAMPNDKTAKTKSHLARLLIRWGESDEGYNLLHEIASEQTDDPREFEKLADAMVAVGDWERAAEFLGPVLERYPGDYRLRYLLAVCQEETDALSEATGGFLAVLGSDEELKQDEANKNANRMNWYVEELNRIAPAGLTDLITATQSAYSAYSYRQNRGGMRVYSTSGHGQRSSVSLPGSLDQARSLALAHLGQISAGLEDDQAADLRESVKSLGGPEADSVLAMNRGTTPQNQRINYDALEDVAERPAVLALLAMRGAQAQGLPDELFGKAADLFEESHPEIALMAALNGLKKIDSDSEQGKSLLKQAERLLGSIDKPSTVTISTVCQWRSGLGQNQAVAAPQELKDRVRDRLVEWYPKLRAQQNYGPWIMMQVASILSEGDDPKPYVRFLQAEVDRYKKAPNKNANQAMFFGRQQNNLVSRPTFPPAKLRTVPPNLVGMIAPSRGGPRISFGGQRTKTDWEPKAMKAALEVVTDPTLRLLLSYSIDDQELVENEIKALLKVDPPSLDAYQLAAGWACEREKPREAIELLSKARFLPMNREERRALDGSLVALVQELVEELSEEEIEQEANKSLVQTGRDAALRLRHGQLDSQQRSLLATALTEFGLEKEADRLEKAGKTAAATRPSYNPGRVAPPSADQIRKLLDAGKTDAAARRLAQELRGYVSQVQQQPNNRSYMSYQVEQFLGRVRKYGIVDETLAQLDPEDSKAHRKHAEFAIALDLCGQDKRAAAAYARALELRPKEDAYRVKLMLSHAYSDQLDEVAEHLDQLGKAGPSLLAQEITASVHDHRTPIERRLQAMEVACMTLEHHAEHDPKADASWTPAIRQAIANQMHSNSGWLPSLYATRNSQNYGRRVSKETVAKRRELHDRFCDAMLRFGSAGCDAFAGLLAADRAQEAATDESKEKTDKPAKERDFLAVAQQAVEGYEPPRPSGIYQTHVVHYNSGSGRHRLISPAEYLVGHCSDEGDWSLLDDQVLPALESGRNAVMRDALKRLRELYTVDESEFLTTAESFTRRWRGHPTNAPGGENKPEMIVLECYGRRGLTVDMTPLFDKLLKTSSQVYGNAPQWWIDYASHLAEHQTDEAAAEWLEKIAKETLGPRERRAKHIAKHYSNNGWSHNSPNGRMHEFEQFLQRVAQRRELFLATACFLPESEVGPLAKNVTRNLQNSSWLSSMTDADEVIQLLERVGLLAEAGELPLTPILSGPAGEGVTLSEILSTQMQRLDAKLRGEVRKKLAAREPRTLGVVLSIGELADRNKPASKEDPPVHEFAAQHLDRLKALEGNQAYRVAQRVGGATAYARILGKQDDELAERLDGLFRWIDEQREKGSNAFTEKFAKIKRFEELGVEGHELDEWIVETVAPLTKTDPDVAATTFLRVCDLFDDAQRRGTTNYSFGRATSIQMLSQMSWRWRQAAKDDPAGPLRLLLAIARHEEGDTVPMSQRNFNQLSNEARQAFDRLSRSSNGKRQGPAKTIAKQHEWITVQFGDDFSPLLGAFYGERLKRNNEKNLKAIESWLTDVAPRETDASQAAADDLLAWTRIALATRQSRNNKQPKDRPALGEPFEYFEATMRDDELPLTARTGLANLVAREGRQLRLPLSTAHTVAEVAIQACDAGVRFDDEFEQSFCQNAYHLLKEDPEDPAAVAFCEAWIKRFVDKRPSTKARRGTKSPNNLGAWPGILQFTACCLLRDRPEDAKRVIKRYGPQIGHRHEAIALLTRYGLTDEAARLARAGWSKLPLTTDSRSEVFFDSRVEQAMPALVEKLNGPLGYVYEAAIARLPDPKKNQGEAPEQTREARLVSVAERFKDAGLSSEEMIETALLMFRGSEEATDLVGEALAKTAARRKLYAAPNQHNPDLERIAELHKQHALWALRQDDARPAIKFIDKVAVDDNGQFWQLRNLYNRHGSDLWDAMLKRFDSLDEEQLGEIADQSLRLFKQGNFDWSSRFEKLKSLAVTSHLRLGRAEQFEKVVEKLDTNQKQVLKNNGRASIDWDVVNSDLPPGEEATLDERVERLASLLSMAAACEWQLFDSAAVRRERANDRDLAAWKAFFTDQELATAALAVADKVEDKNGSGWASAALALSHAQEHTLAAAAWEEAYNAANGTLKAAYGAKQAEALYNSGETEAAAELYLARIASEKPTGWAKGLYDRLAKKLGDAIRPKTADAPGTEPDTEATKKAEPAGDATPSEATTKTAPEDKTPAADAPAAVPSAA